MAEAHAAVAFSFAVTPEGVDVQVSFKFRTFVMIQVIFTQLARIVLKLIYEVKFCIIR